MVLPAVSMAGFRDKIGDFESQFARPEDAVTTNGIKIISARAYEAFFYRQGGPHYMEGLLQENQYGPAQYLNIRRSVYATGEIFIEPITRIDDRVVVAEDPKKIHGYRIKITSGNFLPNEGRWEYEAVRTIDAQPGAEIDKVHHQLDSALRVKFSLAERMLHGEDVLKFVEQYTSEQTFYRGGFGEIVGKDPLREPYLRDALVDAIDKVVTSGEHSEIRHTKRRINNTSQKDEFELSPNVFMDAPIKNGSVRAQKIGKHCIVIFSESKASTVPGLEQRDVANQFELHGGRASLIYEKIAAKNSSPLF